MGERGGGRVRERGKEREREKEREKEKKMERERDIPFTYQTLYIGSVPCWQPTGEQTAQETDLITGDQSRNKVCTHYMST